MRNFFLWLLIALFTAPLASVYAFMPNPDLLTVSPAVARVGETVEITIAGKNLDEADLLRFSHPKLVGKPVMLPADEFHPAPRPVTSKFTLVIPDDVEPGVYEVRSHGYFGLSTARPFLVLPKDASEISEIGDHSTQETAMELALDAGVLGTLDSGKFDWYRFSAKKGQRVLLQLTAEQLDSKADTLLAVYSADGRELENSRHHVGRDPFVDFTAPEDGVYFISLTDSLYKGGKDYFYHFGISTGPHVDFVFPPAGEPGKTSAFTFFGRNLPGGSPGGGWTWKGKLLETLEKQVAVPAEVKTHPGFDSGIPRRGILPAFREGVEGSNLVKIGFATAPVVLEDRKVTDQEVPVPTEVAGRFDEPGDTDSFRISVKKGQTLWIEVVSHRLGSVVDPFVMVEKVTKAEDGSESFVKVGENDDLDSFYGLDSFDDLNADSLDPAMSFTAEEAGEFRVTILNQSAGGSPAHRYRLAIREAQEGFQLIAGTELTKTINNDAFPAAPLLRKGGSMVYRVFAFRNDGFEGDITVIPQGLPAGVAADPLVLSGSSQEGFLTLWASKDAAPWSGKIDIVGTASINGKEEKSIARPASIIWGTRVFGNATQIRSRLDLETVLSVIDVEAEPTRMTLKEEKVLEVTEGETLEIPILLTDSGQRTGALQVDVHGFPGLHRNPPKVAIPETEKEAVLKFSFVKSGTFALTPGQYQFVLRGVGNRKYERNLAASKEATVEYGRLKALLDSFPEKTAAVKAELTNLEKELAAAKQREAAAADDSARAALKAETAMVENRIKESQAKLAANETSAKRLKALTDAAKKTESTAVTAAKEKTNQFATFSQPITVVVKPKSAP